MRNTAPNLAAAFETRKRSEPGSGVPLASDLWPVALFSCRFNGRALLPMFGAIPAVLVVENLVSSGLSLELDDEDCLHPGAVTGG